MIATASTVTPLGADWLARAGWGVSALLHAGLAAAVIGWSAPDETPPQLVAVSVVMVSADALDGGGDEADAAASDTAVPTAAPATPAGPARPAPRPKAQPAADAVMAPEPPQSSSPPPAAPSALARVPEPIAAETPPPEIDAAMPPRPAVKPAPPARVQVTAVPPPAPPEIAPATGSPDSAAAGAVESSSPQTAAVPALPAAPAAGSATGVPGPGAGVVPAAALANPEPGYPAVSRQRGEEGRVVLQAEVSAAGTVTSLTIKRSSGHARLDRAALEAVRRWRFAPAQIGEQPVASTLEVPIVFTLTR